MSQNINKGNLYQAASKAGLNPAQQNQINSLAEMYSTHTSLSNLPDSSIHVPKIGFNHSKVISGKPNCRRKMIERDPPINAHKIPEIKYCFAMVL